MTDRDGLRAFQEFMRQLARAGEEAARNGWTLEEMAEKAEVDADAGYEVLSIPFVLRLDREFVLRRAWEETRGGVQRIQLPESPQP